MSTKLRDTIYYILKNYPNIKDLSNARLTKLVYLADWHQSINYFKKITNVEWYFDNYGPFVKDIKNEIDSNPNYFSSITTRNIFGNQKTIFKLEEDLETINLDENEKKSIDFAIEKTKKLDWNNFIKLVYSTYPIVRCERYSTLDLVNLAKEYKEK